VTAEKLDRFEASRRRLFRLAYQLLGEATEAEDVVQDAYLRWERSEGISVPEAWLTKVVTNLCLNRLTSARVRREHYVGQWLPEPVLTTGGELGPLETVEQRDSLSFGMLVLLERLTPPERAAFVLREAFDYRHREIAEVLELDETHVRQLYRRAREHLGEPRKRFTATPEQGEKIVERFLAATVHGDVAGLEQLLAEDVVTWSDGGGKATAARHPVIGRVRVARFLTGLARHRRAAAADIAITSVNGGPALLVTERGAVTSILVPEFGDGRIVAIRAVTNPDKLAFAAAQHL
jgi:RNA polymerase sigma-70 factor (TIGR02957 family)